MSIPYLSSHPGDKFIAFVADTPNSIQNEERISKMGGRVSGIPTRSGSAFEVIKLLFLEDCRYGPELCIKNDFFRDIKSNPF